MSEAHIPGGGYDCTVPLIGGPSVTLDNEISNMNSRGGASTYEPSGPINQAHNPDFSTNSAYQQHIISAQPQRHIPINFYPSQGSVSAHYPSQRSTSPRRQPFPILEAPPAAPSRLYLISGTKVTQEAICREFLEVETRIARNEHYNQILANQIQWLHQELIGTQNELAETRRELFATKQELNTRIYEHKEEIITLEGKIHASNGSGDEEDSSVLGQGNADAQAGKVLLEASVAAANDSKVINLVSKMFGLFLGIARLNDRNLFPVITNNNNESGIEELPFLPGSTEIRQVRFHWDKKASDSHNHQSIITIAEVTKKHGSMYGGVGVLECLGVITMADMIERVQTKFTSLQKVWRGTTGKQKAGEGEFSKAKKNNRAAGKLEVRLRKRQALPEDSEWREKKYDSAFFIQLMSDDEDLVNDAGVVDKIRYQTFIPSYRSGLMQDLLDAIDSEEDPAPSSQYKPRIQGGKKEQGPPVTKTLAGRARRWMVDEEWLKQNKEAAVISRVADNGRLWGDDEDPEETQARVLNAKADKAEAKRRLSALQNDSEDKTKKAKVSNKAKGKQRQT